MQFVFEGGTVGKRTAHVPGLPEDVRGSYRHHLRRLFNPLLADEVPRKHRAVLGDVQSTSRTHHDEQFRGNSHPLQILYWNQSGADQDCPVPLGGAMRIIVIPSCQTCGRQMCYSGVGMDRKEMRLYVSFICPEDFYWEVQFLDYRRQNESFLL
jgi:hypothetical protein